MLDNFKQLVANQYESAFCTLHECIVRCPNDIWFLPVANHTFSCSVFHALFFADFYLGLNKAAQRVQGFHLEHSEIFADYEQLEDRIPIGSYEKSFVLEYLKHCRDKARDVLANETEQQLNAPAGFSWLKTRRSEVHVYNIRHIQHHAAQLILILRKEKSIDMPWVKSGWQEFSHKE